MPLPVSANYPKFKTDELFAFIKEYEKHRMLYDFDHPLYTNYVERTKRFMMISKALNIDGLTPERVRAKIKVFRGNYTHRLKEMYKKMKLGEEFNAPSWWYTADRFLRPHIRFLDPDISDVNPQRNPRTDGSDYYSDGPASADDGDDDMDDTGKDNEEDNEDDNEESIYLELDDAQLMAIENGEMSIEEVAAKAEEAAKSQRRSTNRPSRAEKPVGTKRANDGSNDVADESVNDNDENPDEFDAFGRCVALQLKTLPIDAALELETQIHSLITKQRLAYLRQLGGT